MCRLTRVVLASAAAGFWVAVGFVVSVVKYELLFCRKLSDRCVGRNNGTVGQSHQFRKSKCQVKTVTWLSQGALPSQKYYVWKQVNMKTLPLRTSWPGANVFSWINWNKHAQQTCLMYHAAWKVKLQPFNQSYSQLMLFQFSIFLQKLIFCAQRFL